MPPNAARLVGKGAASGRIEGMWLLSSAEMARAQAEQPTVVTALDLGASAKPPEVEPALRELFEAYDHDPEHGKLEYFPANRRLAPREGSEPLGIEAEARLRAGNSPTKYAMIKQALAALGLRDGVKTLDEAARRGLLLRNEQRDSLAAHKRDVAAMLPHLRLVGVELDEEGAPELCFERSNGARLELDDLSESEKQAVLFSATFRRIGLSRSIVLVDQPELHLHADTQLGFVRALEGLGHDNQLFLATGSLEITRTAATHQVVRLGAGKA